MILYQRLTASNYTPRKHPADPICHLIGSVPIKSKRRHPPFTLIEHQHPPGWRSAALRAVGTGAGGAAQAYWRCGSGGEVDAARGGQRRAELCVQAQANGKFGLHAAADRQLRVDRAR